MAITFPVSLVIPLLGDGVTTMLNTYLAPLLIQQGLPGTTVPQLIATATMSDGSAVTCTLSGQTLTSTFATAPANLVQLRISVTLGV